MNARQRKKHAKKVIREICERTGLAGFELLPEGVTIALFQHGDVSQEQRERFLQRIRQDGVVEGFTSYQLHRTEPDNHSINHSTLHSDPQKEIP